MDNANTTNRYPFDFDSMKKGDVITVDRLEHLTGRKYGTKAYDLAIMPIVKIIENGLSRLGRPVTCCTAKGQIKILTDPEASDYLENRNNANVREQRSIVRHSLQVDHGNLTEAQKSLHDRRVRQQSLELQGRTLGRRGKIPFLPEKDERPRITG